MPKNDKLNASINLIEERSLKTLKFIEEQVSETDEVTSGEVMAVLAGALKLFIDDVRQQLGEDRANKIATDLMLVLMLS